MRVTFFIVLFALLTNFAGADEIDNLVTNLPPGWNGGPAAIISLPETNSIDRLLKAAFHVNYVDNGHTTNFTILKLRKIAIPRAHFRGAYTDPYTAALVQTDHGQKIVLCRDSGDGWWTRVFPYPPDLSPVIGGDPIWNWFDFPARRDPLVHLVFFEIESITNEHHAVTESSNSKVSDDGGKTWYNLLDNWSGVATLKIIESPGVEMPVIIEVPFERSGYIHTRDGKKTDWLVKPGAKLIGFFSQTDGKWSLSGGFLNPHDYLSISEYGTQLQALFKTPLAEQRNIPVQK